MKASEIYSTKEKFWGVLMILALLWLTICLPIVNDAREQMAKQTTTIPLDDNPVENCEDSNPLSNSVEEKSSGNSSILEEYLHHALEDLAPDDPELSHIDLHSYDTYIAFHGELLSPPPESLLS